jgi:Ca-activated chloride channel homolog
VHSRLDEKMLTAIAQTTGGNYYPLGPLGEGLAKVRAAVETLDRTEGRQRAHNRGIDRHYWPVAAALVLLALEPLVGTRRKNRKGK